MRQNLYCPKCYKAVDAEQSFDGICVCTCGQVVQLDRRTNKKKKSVSASNVWLYTIAVLIMAGTLQVANWDIYSAEIVPLKAKQWTSQASIDDLNRINEICGVRMKLNCQKETLLALYELEGDKKHLIKAGELELKLEMYEAAVKNLGAALQLDSKNQELRYNYAKALMGAGDNLNAAKQLHFLVFKRSRTVNATAALDYIDLLILSNDYRLAKKVILRTRKKAKYAGMFAHKQLQLINEKIAASKVARGH